MVPRNRGWASGLVGTMRVAAWVKDLFLTASVTIGPTFSQALVTSPTTTRTSGASPVTSVVSAINGQLETPPVRVRVMERRPADNAGELQGLYEPDEVTGGVARITVWMRTARKEQVVKYRTFLRTLAHELCHHFDYELFGLAETFHTQGFYSRESALVRELLGEARP